jgi:flagellar biosynthesis protein FlhF
MNTGHPAARNRTDASLPFAPSVYKAESPEPSSEIDALRAELRSEVRALRSLVSRGAAGGDLGSELAGIRAALDDLASMRVVLDEVLSGTKRDRVSAILRARGIEGAAASRLRAAAAERTEGDPAERLRAAVGEVIAVAAWPLARHEPSVVAAVGPAGVGKTTTIAKLAARARMEGRSVAFVTCDGFRVGAVDQLERYAELLGADVHVARGPADLRGLLDEATADIVFVDTSGQQPTASSPEASLRALRRGAFTRPIDVLLCMPAAARATDAARIAAAFGQASPTAVCITKLDETAMPAGLAHGPLAAKLPLAVLAFGPRVPEDVSAAEPDDVAVRLVPSQERPR